MPRNAVYTTLLTKPNYLVGVLVLHYCLVAVGSRYPLVVMVTPDLPDDCKDILEKRGIATREIDHLRPEPGAHELSKADERFHDTWTKLRVFELDEYNRVVMLDADMIVMRNMDELMDLELPADWIAAVHVCACNPRKLKHYPEDWIPKNCAHTGRVHPSCLTSPIVIDNQSPRPYTQLNSGTVVLNPSKKLFEGIEEYLLKLPQPKLAELKFPDQDLLALYFKGKWKPLPWCYNALKTLRVIHPQSWRDEEIRCLHYIFSDKPWFYPPGAAIDPDYAEVHQWWWDRFERLRTDMEDKDPENWQRAHSIMQEAQKEYLARLEAATERAASEPEPVHVKNEI